MPVVGRIMKRGLIAFLLSVLIGFAPGSSQTSGEKRISAVKDAEIRAGVEAAVFKKCFPPRPKATIPATSPSAPTAARSAATDLARAGLLADGRRVSAPGPHAAGPRLLRVRAGLAAEGRQHPLRHLSRATHARSGCLRGLKIPGRHLHLHAAETRRPARFQPGDAPVDRPVRALADQGLSAGDPGPDLLRPHGRGDLRRHRLPALAEGAAAVDGGGRQVPADPEEGQRPRSAAPGSTSNRLRARAATA